MSVKCIEDSVSKHHDASADKYSVQYRRRLLLNTDRDYPATFRLQILLNSFASKGLKREIEVGVGELHTINNLGQCGYCKALLNNETWWTSLC